MLGERPLPTESSFLTPFHILVFGLALLSLLSTQLDEYLPPAILDIAEMAQRASFLLVIMLLMFHLVAHSWDQYNAGLKKRLKKGELKAELDLKGKTKMKKGDDIWENEASHPSAFLTTKDGKPRIWPFPLGKAGPGTKDLWWEAGNAAHVGHFKRSELPEAKEELRLKMEAKEAERAKKAKAQLDEMEERRLKWMKRMTNLKLVGTIVVIGLFHKPAGAVCLAGLIYWQMASSLAKMLEPPPPPEKDESEYPALKKKKIPIKPGLGMTYLYEPVGDGLAPSANIPIRSPAHRLMTTTDSRYAS